jgi:hypothetical protein
VSDLLHKNSQCTVVYAAIAGSGCKGGTHSDDKLIAVRREGPQSLVLENVSLLDKVSEVDHQMLNTWWFFPSWRNTLSPLYTLFCPCLRNGGDMMHKIIHVHFQDYQL